MENATYPVIVEEKDGHIILTFPSFGNIVTDVNKGDYYIKAAQEVIALQLASAEDERGPIPNYDLVPEFEPDIKLKKGQKLVYVNVWMPYHRTIVRTVYVRKNLTIPAWLNQLAEASNVNFSEVLTEALKDRLGINS